jgi:hypothetical protein
MDQVSLVESQIDDGYRLAQLLVAAGFDVKALFWIRPQEEKDWCLYIVSKTYDEKGPTIAYGMIADALPGIPHASITMSDVSVIGESDPMAKDVLSIQDQHPGPMAVRSRQSRLGNVEIDEDYVYPPGAGSEGIGSRRKTRIVGEREECSGGEKRVVAEEIGVVEGVIGEEIFNRSYARLITEKFGSVEAFASYYPKGYYQVLPE